MIDLRRWLHLATVAPTRPPGLWRDEHHRYFYGDRGPFPSVTRITGIVDKSGPLVGWAKRETAASAVRNVDSLKQMIASGGPEAAQRWLSSIPDYQRDTSADIGKRVHALADDYGRGVAIQPSADEEPYLRAYLRFLAYVKPRITHSETMVLSIDSRFGGTFDLGCEIDGAVTLLDIKTGNNVYAETALQLAGYAEAEFTATPDNPTQIDLPEWDRFGVVHLRPDDWTLIPFDITEDTRMAFHAARELYTWVKEDAPTAIGYAVKEGSF